MPIPAKKILIVEDHLFFRAGARAYVLKQELPEAVVAAIRTTNP